jgi:hypothetical protein
MSRAAFVAVLFVAAVGCDKKPEGLPPAKSWSSGSGSGSPGAPPVANDPHAGVPGAPPLGGPSGGADPHAGVPGAPPLGGPGGGNPHGGAAPGGVDVTQLGLPAPDPSRTIDPNRYLEGTITLGGAHAGKVPPGSVIFLSVKSVDPATGQGVGMPMAAEKLIAGASWPIAFRLDESKMMIAGTQLAGDVVITARYDQDHEARTKDPGDISGQVRAQVPAKGLTISLDQLQQ